MLSRRVALSLVALGILIRLSTLGRQSLWLDEAFGVWVATAHDAEVIWTSRLDPNEPALFYVVLHYVLALLGVSEATARLPAAMTSIAGIGLAWWLGRVLWPGTGAARLAGVLVALAPIDVWFAQEARMHGMIGAAGLAVALGLWLTHRWAVLLLIAGVAGGLMIDHTMWPVAIAVLGVWLVTWWRSGHPTAPLVTVLAALAVAGAIYAPVWPEAVSLYTRFDTVSSIMNLRHATGLPTLTFGPLPLVLLVMLVGSSVAAALWHRVPAAFRSGGVVVLFMAGTAAMAVPRAYGMKQIAVCFWPLLIVLVAGAVTRSRRPWIPVVWSGLFLMATLPHTRADWRGVTEHLQRTRPHAVVLLDSPLNERPYHFYRPGAPFLVGPSRDVGTLEKAGVGREPACLVVARFGARPPTSASEAWMDANLTLESETRFSRLALRCYRLSAPGM